MVGATPESPKWGKLDVLQGYELPEPGNDFDREVLGEVLALYRLLREKNRAYGNSALEPLRVFSKADPAEQIRVRLDDKLSRLARGAAAGEDVERDLLGNIVLIRNARKPAEAGAR
jgi:hypothetical protein